GRGREGGAGIGGDDLDPARGEPLAHRAGAVADVERALEAAGDEVESRVKLLGGAAVQIVRAVEPRGAVAAQPAQRAIERAVGVVHRAALAQLAPPANCPRADTDMSGCGRGHPSRLRRTGGASLARGLL